MSALLRKGTEVRARRQRTSLRWPDDPNFWASWLTQAGKLL